MKFWCLNGVDCFVVLSDCNTAQGPGKDIERGGEATRKVVKAQC
jgi:predicted small secreted protein